MEVVVEENFWHERWKSDDIGFHRPEVNPILIEHFPRLGATSKQTILVPLCGKSLDMLWLAQQGLNVVGVELSEIAAKSFFAENHLTYDVTKVNHFNVYRGDQVQIFVGDFFDFQADLIDRIDYVYDRAALIALQEDMRQRYADTLSSLCQLATKMLLLSMAYDCPGVSGPPFSVNEVTVRALYAAYFDIDVLSKQEVTDVSERMQKKGIASFTDYVFQLTKS